MMSLKICQIPFLSFIFLFFILFSHCYTIYFIFCNVIELRDVSIVQKIDLSESYGYLPKVSISAIRICANSPALMYNGGNQRIIGQRRSEFGLLP